jgi:hypothetical protein
MRKQFCQSIFFLGIVFFLFSCSKMKPENYFNIAVLNTNLIAGFANTGFSRELQSPSVKMSENGDEPVSMKRSEVLDSKIAIVEENYEKVKSLKVTDETKDMIETSVNLYDYVIPVYKNEYAKLAGLYDNNAPQAQTEALTMDIFDKYYQGFTDRYSKLISTGKVYAEKNSIKVNWGDR